MIIKFLGTSAGWPLPRLGCKCTICSSKDPKDTRGRTQILIDGRVLLDAGPETYHHLKNEDIAKLEAILISHEHPDHILGLWDLPHIYGRKETGLNNINLYVTQPVLNGIRKIFQRDFGPIKPIVVSENQTFAIGNAKVTYIPVIHGNTPAYAIKYKETSALRSSTSSAGLKDGKIFTYITDFNRILPSSQTQIRHSHVIALDGSSLGKIGQGPGHISIKDGIIIGKNLKAKEVYFVHIGHKTDTHKRLERYLEEEAGPKFHIAFDGLELKL
ncbi:hypothetical protein A2870_00080 [Candidatus Curtissbacteria bacterium RIFCSPHIGHO2_01_FULL_41_11]|uniref:Metallo-beta-lactamase domain-containing protein n=1 Tax=Candidatus Curtissbacteria bacterium RIFCSPHIGHO2_01_FULL_41_11 TaxID=1797711 RepID=A0A1F5G3B6_9BACT|nr:MAG: hypothetical protein A2870_00080 [Candidatus Curtissbacteria bacterium RIFCSPHIGHO2_01_FULL_41_11]